MFIPIGHILESDCLESDEAVLKHHQNYRSPRPKPEPAQAPKERKKYSRAPYVLDVTCAHCGKHSQIESYCCVRKFCDRACRYAAQKKRNRKNKVEETE